MTHESTGDSRGCGTDVQEDCFSLPDHAPPQRRRYVPCPRHTPRRPGEREFKPRLYGNCPAVRPFEEPAFLEIGKILTHCYFGYFELYRQGRDLDPAFSGKAGKNG